MGQYFIAVNHSKREWLHPPRFGDGLKFSELCGSSHGMLAGLAHLLKAPEGSWVGDEVAIVGDYDSGDLYELAMDSYKDVSFDVMREMAKDPYARPTMHSKTAWRRTPLLGEALADPEEHAFYKELFGDLGKEKS